MVKIQVFIPEQEFTVEEKTSEQKERELEREELKEEVERIKEEIDTEWPEDDDGRSDCPNKDAHEI